MNQNLNGGLAQLGERLAGSQKVRGSSPLSSILNGRMFWHVAVSLCADLGYVKCVFQHAGGCDPIQDNAAPVFAPFLQPTNLAADHLQLDQNQNRSPADNASSQPLHCFRAMPSPRAMDAHGIIPFHSWSVSSAKGEATARDPLVG